MKCRMIAVLSAAALLLSGCGDKPEKNEQKAEDALVDLGIRTIELLDELAESETYKEAMISSYLDDFFTEIKENTDIIDCKKPDGVYQLDNPQSVCRTLLSENNIDLSDMSEKLENYMLGRIIQNIWIQINGSMGVDYVAVSSVLNANQIFVSNSITENSLCIFTYEDCYPVLVGYNTGNDGAVSVAAGFIINDELIGCGEEKLEDFINDSYILRKCSLTRLK